MADLPGWLALERSADEELIERAGHDRALLADNLNDIRRVNRWLGGTRLTLRALDSLTAGLTPGDELSLLDVGTGSGDIPVAVAAWERRRGLRTRVTALDISVAILTHAQPADGVWYAAGDALRLPLADHSVDICVCSLFLHHLEPPAAVQALREMRRVARRGAIVNDLVRGRPWYLGALLLARLASRNPLTRHDGPLSVRRAYTTAEMAELAARAGFTDVRFDRRLGFRVAMTGDVS